MTPSLQMRSIQISSTLSGNDTPSGDGGNVKVLCFFYPAFMALVVVNAMIAHLLTPQQAHSNGTVHLPTGYAIQTVTVMKLGGNDYDHSSR